MRSCICDNGKRRRSSQRVAGDLGNQSSCRSSRSAWPTSPRLHSLRPRGSMPSPERPSVHRAPQTRRTGVPGPRYSLAGPPTACGWPIRDPHMVALFFLTSTAFIRPGRLSWSRVSNSLRCGHITLFARLRAMEMFRRSFLCCKHAFSRSSGSTHHTTPQSLHQHDRAIINLSAHGLR